MEVKERFDQLNSVVNKILGNFITAHHQIPSKNIFKIFGKNDSTQKIMNLESNVGDESRNSWMMLKS